MKKAKFMLTTIAIIAITGGFLAFKAGSFIFFDLCTTTLDPIQGCPNLCEFISLESIAAPEPDFPCFCFTAIPHEESNNDLTCQQLNCSNKGCIQ